LDAGDGAGSGEEPVQIGGFDDEVGTTTANLAGQEKPPNYKFHITAGQIIL
jgi:hypothetical protein